MSAIEFAPIETPAVVIIRKESLRYGEPKPLKLDEHSQSLRGRMVEIHYTRDGVTYGRKVACPLGITDNFNVATEKLRKLLIDNKISLSSVVNITTNHSLGKDACQAIIRRAVAARA